MADRNDRQAKPSEADIAAAKRMRAIWEAIPRINRPTQDQLADALDTNQSAVSQYLNGLIPLNFKATLIFAKELGCRPEEIRTDLPEFLLVHEFWDVGLKQLKKAPIPPRWPFSLDKERYDALNPEQKQTVERLLDQVLLALEGPPPDSQSTDQVQRV